MIDNFTTHFTKTDAVHSAPPHYPSVRRLAEEKAANAARASSARALVAAEQERDAFEASLKALTEERDGLIERISIVEAAHERALGLVTLDRDGMRTRAEAGETAAAAAHARAETVEVTAANQAETLAKAEARLATAEAAREEVAERELKERAVVETLMSEGNEELSRLTDELAASNSRALALSEENADYAAVKAYLEEQNVKLNALLQDARDGKMASAGALAAAKQRLSALNMSLGLGDVSVLSPIPMALAMTPASAAGASEDGGSDMGDIGRDGGGERYHEVSVRSQPEGPSHLQPDDSELNESVEVLEASVALLQERLESSTSSNMEGQWKLLRMKEEHQATEHYVQKLNQQLGELEVELRDAREQHRSSSVSYSTREQDLETQLDEGTMKRRGLEAEASKRERVLRDMARQDLARSGELGAMSETMGRLKEEVKVLQEELRRAEEGMETLRQTESANMATIAKLQVSHSVLVALVFKGCA